MVAQAEAGKLQVGLPLLGEELLTVLLPDQPGLGGAPGPNNLQRAVQPVRGPVLPHIEHLLLKPALIHTGLSCR